MSSEIAAAGICLCHIIVLNERKRAKRKRWWRRQLFEDGSGHSLNLLDTLKMEDGAGFRNFTRMNLSDFEHLLELIGQQISKEDTVLRKAIAPPVRLAVALRYLASGDSFTSLSYTFKISKQSISVIVPQVCEALIMALRQYVKLPASSEEWMAKARDFAQIWNYPHCIGSIDGKHVQILAPENSGSMFFNYKGTFSIVLLGVSDATYNFIYADVGCQGRISDGGVFKHTSLYNKLQTGQLNLPPEEALPGRQKLLPYVFVADDAFALSRNIMKPYPGHQPGSASPERVFNYRLCRPRNVIEDCFGLMSSKFRVLLKPIALHPDKVETVVLTCIYLHNFLRRNGVSRNFYSPPGSFDSKDSDGNMIPGSWRTEVADGNALFGLQNTPRRTPNEAQEIRDEFRDYFVSNVGSVPWQYDYA